jgi:hypothetical protein
VVSTYHRIALSRFAPALTAKALGFAQRMRALVNLRNPRNRRIKTAAPLTLAQADLPCQLRDSLSAESREPKAAGNPRQLEST